jgi:hypothetical protein
VRLEADRLPCFATRTPAAATTSAARAARVEQIVVPPRHLHRLRAHRPREADDLDRPLAFHREADEQRRDVRRRRAPFHHLGHRRGGFVRRQVLVSRQLFDELLKHRPPQSG